MHGRTFKAAHIPQEVTIWDASPHRGRVGMFVARDGENCLIMVDGSQHRAHYKTVALGDNSEAAAE